MASVFITGGTSGIGLALAKKYLKEGYEVGICARNIKRLPSKLKQHSRLFAYELDVSHLDKLEVAVRDFSKGELDIMIVNAGISSIGEDDLPRFDNARALVQTNIIGAINSIDIGFRNLKRGGQIVTISSLASFLGLPKAGAYSGTKAFINKFCEGLSIDIEKYGISMTNICPGFVVSDITNRSIQPKPFIMSANKASEIIYEGVQKRKSLVVFPFVLYFVIKFVSLLPRSLSDLLLKKVMN